MPGIKLVSLTRGNQGGTYTEEFNSVQTGISEKKMRIYSAQTLGQFKAVAA